MYTLANTALEVSILDPIADQGRFGPRYCTGGYIFQVADTQLGDLLSGPTYPDAFNWFDGQGIPDAFHPTLQRDPASTDGLTLMLGIGLCDLQAKEVKEFCTWEVAQAETSITMRTTHRHYNYVVELERTVTLVDRTVRSFTRITNRGQSPIPMRWYPHPFYPQPTGDELVKFNNPVELIEDEGYRLGDNGFIARKGWPWQKGYYLSLNHTPTHNLVVFQKHPKLGLVAGTCSYAPDYFPIWGNPRTFSWEPYLEHTVGHGQEFSWWIDYEF
jgi:hypothetical protein